jgi:hypothetical protein
MYYVVGLVFIAAGIGAAVLLARKVRQIHLATFRLLDDTAAIRREVESLYAQLQAAKGLEQVLSLDAPLPPLRGWAGSPDFLLHLANHLLKHRAETVLECSSGASTLVAARCMKLNGRGHVWSLEHDEAFAEKTRELLRQHGLEAWATVLHSPLASINGAPPWYTETVLPDSMPAAEVLVIDGPPESTTPLARAPAFARLRSRLTPGACVFIDDAHRPDERAMLEQWKLLDPGLVVEQLQAEKGLALVRLPS